MKNSSEQQGPPGREFALWLHHELTARGYDLSGPRSGGKGAFAEDSGISPSTVGRLLRGERVHDTRVLGLLADALHVPLGEVLVRAGVLTQDQLGAVQHPPESAARRITPEQAADELGISDAQQRALFIAMTHTLRRQPPPGTDGNGEERLA